MDFPSSRTLALLLFPAFCTPAVAQAPDSLPPTHARIAPLVAIGGDGDDRLRTSQLLGEVSPDGYLLRSPSSLTPAPGGSGLRWSFVAPEVRASWNSDIPFSINDGAMWAGRGLSTQLRAGFQLAYGGLRLIVAPEIVSAQNSDLEEHLYPEFLERQGGRLVPVWSSGRHSIDLPYRYGQKPFARLEGGQSTLAYQGGALSIGLSTEHQWWGPGIRSAIVLSNNAPGIPHAFVRTSAPLQTPIGAFSARWMLGELRESEHFDTLSANDLRSYSAAAATWQPAGQPGLTLGVARAVYAPIGNTRELGSHFADALVLWNQRYDPPQPSDSEQILSLFARWVLPPDGVEVYAEWARHALPGGGRDLLVAPEHSQGYTLGLQWIKRLHERSLLRLQGELTYLEQSPTFRSRPLGSWYASRSIPQGYTHRGQVIGAAIGPGGSSQWLATDFLTPDWRLGVFVERIRWANDAYYSRIRYTPGWVAQHDVSFRGGIRTSFEVAGVRMEGSWAAGKRYNYLFQSKGTNWTNRENSISPITHTLNLSLSPFGNR